MMKTREKRTTQVVLLSILCVVLTILLGSFLLTSVSMRHAAQERVLTAAVEKFPMEEITLNESSAAQYILDEFVADDRVNLENVQRVMQDGTFSAFAAELMDRYNTYLLEGGTFPRIEPEEFVRLIEENEALILKETGLRFLEPDKQKLRENLALPLEEWNITMVDSMQNGVSGFAARAVFSVWLPVVLGILLLAVMVWMIVFYVRGGYRAGTAIKLFSTALFVPCAVMFLLLVLTDGITAEKIPFIRQSMGMFYDTLLPIAGIASLVCAVIFFIGILCSVISAKRHPAVPDYDGGYDGESFGDDSEPDPVPEEPEIITLDDYKDPDPDAKRRFCRSCGHPLVNPDARFCYKCGNLQETVQKNESS